MNIRHGLAFVSAAALLGACASAGTVNDGGRAARALENEPPHDNDLAGWSAEPSVPVIERRVDTPLGKPSDDRD